MMLCGGVASYTPATAGGGLLALSPPTSKSPPPQNNRAGELGPLPSQGVLLTQYTVFHNILCRYALRVKKATLGDGLPHARGYGFSGMKADLNGTYGRLICGVSQLDEP